MHTLAASSPQVRGAVRALQAARGSNGFANSVTMANPHPHPNPNRNPNPHPNPHPHPNPNPSPNPNPNPNPAPSPNPIPTQVTMARQLPRRHAPVLHAAVERVRRRYRGDIGEMYGRYRPWSGCAAPGLLTLALTLTLALALAPTLALSLRLIETNPETNPDQVRRAEPPRTMTSAEAPAALTLRVTTLTLTLTLTPPLTPPLPLPLGARRSGLRGRERPG